MSEVILAVEGLTKTYRTGVRRKRVNAVDGASFQVQRGEIFGFVGPNGAGKTTTIRCLMGLIRPTSGKCSILGHEIPSRAARQRLGFLPESPYFHDYLTAREMLDFMGRLQGLEGAKRRERVQSLLQRVGLGHALDRPMRKYSKGMLQRAGLAQALVNDPELVVLDEPMSGLDPLGRKDVRDLIVELRDQGKTVFFSTHILPDVEAICDRVAIISGGRIADVGTVGQLLGDALLGAEVVVRTTQSLQAVVPAGSAVRQVEDHQVVDLAADVDVNAFLGKVSALGPILAVTMRRPTLEDLFVKRAHEAAGRAQEAGN